MKTYSTNTASSGGSGKRRSGRHGGGGSSSKWIPLLLILIALTTFGRVIGDGFGPFDNETTLTNNPRLNPPRLAGDSLLWYWSHAEMSLYIPVTYTVWGILAGATYIPLPDETGAHIDPHFFHAASLLLHLMAMLLVYGIVRRLIRSPWPAAAGALLFALHPVQVEAVAWASGMKDLLSAVFSLAANAARGAASGSGEIPVSRSPVPRLYSLRFHILALVCFALALLSKPLAIVVPLLLATIDFWLLRRPIKSIAIALTPWVILAIPIAIIARAVQAGAFIPPIELYQRPVVAGASLAFYLGKIVLPIDLAFGYGWRPSAMVTKGWFYAIALIPLLPAGLLWLRRRRDPALFAAGLIFVAALLPILGLVPFSYQYYSTVADHYLYLAMLGPALAGAALLSRISPRRRRAAIGISAAILLALAIASFAQLRFWVDDVTNLRHIVAVTPQSNAAHGNLGQYHALHGDLAAAEKDFLAAAAGNPDDPQPRRNLLRLYSSLGRAEEAIQQFHELQRANAMLPEANRQAFPPDQLYKAGADALAVRRYPVAERYFLEAVRLNPKDERAREALAKVRELMMPATRKAPP